MMHLGLICFIKTIGFAVLLLIAVYIVVLFILYVIARLAMPRPAPPIHYKINEHPGNLPVGWQGVPVDAKERFINLSFPFYQNYWQVVLWVRSNIKGIMKNYGVKMPVHHHGDNNFMHRNNTVIWLGHASFFMRINGINILIDPHFYNTFLYFRHTENPIPITAFTNIDYILISHDHSDHTDLRSLKQLFQQNPSVTVLTGLGMQSLLRKVAMPSVCIREMAWYDVFKTSAVNISYVPSRHYCKRWNNKFNGNLWGGFILQPKDGKVIYFGGDSGYDKALFATIKKLFAPSVAVLGIGAFEPHYLMFPNHMSPQEALQAFHDTGAEQMIPMHHSTFCLGNELVQEPVEYLRSIQQDENIVYTIPGEIINI